MEEVKLLRILVAFSYSFLDVMQDFLLSSEHGISICPCGRDGVAFGRLSRICGKLLFLMTNQQISLAYNRSLFLDELPEFKHMGYSST